MRNLSRVAALALPLLALSLSCKSHQSAVRAAPAQASAKAGALAASTGASAKAGVAAPAEAAVEATNGPVFFGAVRAGQTPPLTTILGSTREADPTVSQPGREVNELNIEEVKEWANIPTPIGNAAAKASALHALPALAIPSPAPGLTFDGNSAADNTAVFGSTVAPPDTNGAVGPNHYVQITNDLVGIYTKAGTLVSPPGKFALSKLFTSIGGVCATTDDGDIIAQYDKLANRWILSQFGFTSTATPPYHQCVAISKTSDPTGAYYAYDFQLPGQEFPDYPKLGTWPNGYFMSTNQFFLGGNFDGAGAFAFDRAKMLVGDPTAGGIYFNLCFQAGHCTPEHPEGIFGMLPSDFDGLTPPPAGAVANVFSYPTSVTFGDPADGLRVFDFVPNYANPALSTFTERPESTYASPIPVAPWDLRDPGGRGDIFQPAPATGAGNRLDAVASRIMFRLQYQNLGGTESLVSNITVNVSGVPPASAATYKAAVRYFQLSRSSPSGPFSVTEQGTTPSPDATERWMASAAADNSGDIAVGYSASSLSVFPSLRYAGRTPADPPGALEDEQTLFAGTGVQVATGNRWGDYSALQVDPSDFCTFWYTNEYYSTPAGTQFNWRTRIGNFKFPGCVSPAMGTLTGKVTYCQNGLPITGAVLQVSDGHGGATISNGTYAISLPPGTYTVTAVDPAINCANSASQTVTISNGGSATADFCLTGTPLIDLVGDSFDDSAGNGNGTINRNECFKVNTVLKNDGCLAETGISAVLSTSTPEVIIDQNTSAYPNLAINASGANLTPYAARTTSSFVCGTPIDFTLTETSTLGGTRVSHFSFPTCAGAPEPFSGTLTSGDAVATAGRLGRNAVSSVCGTLKGCPGAFDANPRFYDTFSFSNTSAVSECLKVTLDQSSCTGTLLAAGYLDAFDGSNLCLNYLGDEGASPAVGSFSVDVPPGHDLIVAIQQTTVGVFCTTGYTGTVTGFVDNTDAGGDTTPPTISGASASPSSLWPPNNKMVDVTINYSTADACGGPVGCVLSVSSNEGGPADWQVIDAHHVKLRATRNGTGNGRIYTITITCTDVSGNQSTSQVQVTVPHDQGH